MTLDEIHDAILSLEKDPDLTPAMREFLDQLRARRAELLGMTPEEAAREAEEDAAREIEAYLEAALLDDDADEEDDAPDAPSDDHPHGDVDRFLEMWERQTADALEAHMQSCGLPYRRTESGGQIVFHMDIALERCTVHVRAGILAPSILFDVELPIEVDSRYALLLRSEMADINRSLPLGAFVCEADDKLALHYNHLVGNTFDPDAFMLALDILGHAVDQKFKLLQELATGQFPAMERVFYIAALAQALEDLENDK